MKADKYIKDYNDVISELTKLLLFIEDPHDVLVELIKIKPNLLDQKDKYYGFVINDDTITVNYLDIENNIRIKNSISIQN